MNTLAIVATIDERAQVHGALSDPVRLRIVDALRFSDRSPVELGEMFGVASNRLAHHLDVLEAAGLVERTVSNGDRRRRYLRLCPEALADLASVPSFRASGIVFVCTRNSARSQLAAALWNRTSSVPAESAGTDPADRVHPGAIAAAQRRGLDLTGAEPSRFATAAHRDQLVVTVCDLAFENIGEVSASSGLPMLHWSIPDPAATGRRRDFDRTAEAIADRVANLAPAVIAA